jgi:uncharacterized protein YaiE (UPF0345 family)
MPKKTKPPVRPRAARKTAAALPTQLEGVTILTKANLYFDGRVASHTVLSAGGPKKTLGLIFPGSYLFGTGAAERMEIVAGACRVRLDGATVWRDYPAGATFDVPGSSGFDIAVAAGVCEYICTFLP